MLLFLLFFSSLNSYVRILISWKILFRELSKETNILLQFKNKELETSYAKQRESMSSVPLIASVLIHVVASVYSSLILPSSFIHFLIVIAPIILTLPTVWISAAESFPMVCYFPISIIKYILMPKMGSSIKKIRSDGWFGTWIFTVKYVDQGPIFRYFHQLITVPKFAGWLIKRIFVFFDIKFNLWYLSSTFLMKS